MGLSVYIDESGDPGDSLKSSRVFVLAGVLINDKHADEITERLALLRRLLGRQPGHHLHFSNLSTEQRLIAANAISQMPVVVSTVVVGKDYLAPLEGGVPDRHYHLHTLRYLLERISWYARDNGHVARYTVACRPKLKAEHLAGYEGALKYRDTEIQWAHLDPNGGRLDQPKRDERLQIADLVAGSVFAAFRTDQPHNPTYLEALSGALYRRGSGHVTSYGLKLHPKELKAAYPWVATFN